MNPKVIWKLLFLLQYFYLYICTLVQWRYNLAFHYFLAPEKNSSMCDHFFSLKNTLWKRNCEIFNTSRDLVKYLHAFDNNASYQFNFYGVVTNELLSFLAWLSFNISHFFYFTVDLEYECTKGGKYFSNILKTIFLASE